MGIKNKFNNEKASLEAVAYRVKGIKTYIVHASETTGRTKVFPHLMVDQQGHLLHLKHCLRSVLHFNLVSAQSTYSEVIVSSLIELCENMLWHLTEGGFRFTSHNIEYLMLVS